jgi:hypothetical protein
MGYFHRRRYRARLRALFRVVIMKNLNWQDIRAIGKTDGAGRWYPCDDVAEYFASIRSPSRAWPHSYAKAAQTAKFARWLIVNRPEIAAQLKIEP